MYVHVFFPTISSILFQNKRLDILPCAIEQDLITSLLQVKEFASVPVKIPVLPSHLPTHKCGNQQPVLDSMSFFSVEVSFATLWDSREGGTLWCLPFTVALISHSLWVSSPIPVAVNGTLWVLILWRRSILLLSVYNIYLIHSSVDVHVLAIVNSAEMNIEGPLTFLK